MAPHRKDAQALGGAVLRRARERAGVSREQLAEALGVSDSYVEQIEAGIEVAGTLRDVLAAARHLPRLLRALIDELDALAPVHRAPSLPIELHALNVSSESGDVSRAVRAMLADGSVDRNELLELRRELTEGRDAYAAALRDVDGRLAEEDSVR